MLYYRMVAMYYKDTASEKKTKSNGEEMREIVVLAVADDEHGCESSGGKGRRTATRRR